MPTAVKSLIILAKKIVLVNNIADIFPFCAARGRLYSHFDYLRGFVCFGDAAPQLRFARYCDKSEFPQGKADAVSNIYMYKHTFYYIRIFGCNKRIAVVKYLRFGENPTKEKI